VRIRLDDASQLKSAIARGLSGCYWLERTSALARRHRAVFAVNGDFFAARKTGLIIRNGVLLRDKPTGESLVLLRDGELRIVHGDTSGTDLLARGALQAWSFGPALVRDNKNVIGEDASDIPDPRTGIGMVEPLEYVVICVDGRLADSKGLRLIEFAPLFIRHGCVLAYNLDGGGSSTLYMNGRTINRLCSGCERRISDILYIGG
jgi:exopolysaccharide biosynthesis protein